MTKRIGPAVACAAALLVCGCGARSEAETKRAEVMPAANAQTDAQLRTELMTRWNGVGPGFTAEPPGFGQINFVWPALDQFPHPTYKGGSAEAYGAFARALLAFLDIDDNFAFLQRNELFGAELRYVMPSGQVTKWTLLGLTEQLSKPDAHGDHAPAVRKKLAEFADRMKAPPKA